MNDNEKLVARDEAIRMWGEIALIWKAMEAIRYDEECHIDCDERYNWAWKRVMELHHTSEESFKKCAPGDDGED